MVTSEARQMRCVMMIMMMVVMMMRMNDSLNEENASGVVRAFVAFFLLKIERRGTRSSMVRCVA